MSQPGAWASGAAAAHRQGRKAIALRLSILKPSVNSMAVRVLLRSAGLDHSEADAWGHRRSPEFLAKCPAHLTPMLETDGLPRGAMRKSCAIVQYLCNKTVSSASTRPIRRAAP